MIQTFGAKSILDVGLFMLKSEFHLALRFGRMDTHKHTCTLATFSLTYLQEEVQCGQVGPCPCYSQSEVMNAYQDSGL